MLEFDWGISPLGRQEPRNAGPAVRAADMKIPWSVSLTEVVITINTRITKQHRDTKITRRIRAMAMVPVQ